MVNKEQYFLLSKLAEIYLVVIGKSMECRLIIDYYSEFNSFFLNWKFFYNILQLNVILTFASIGMC